MPIRPNLLLVTLDTTRADHLGCYGYARPTSPNLDRLCRDADVYTRAYATSSWTLPTHASLFTGKFPSSHGATYHEQGPLALRDAIGGPDDWSRLAVRPLPEAETTLAEMLRKQGYRTGAVVAGPWLKRLFGLSQGFEIYDEREISQLEGRRADSVTRAAIAMLDKFAASEASPFFLFLNYYDAHIPYRPPKEFARPFVRRLEGGLQEDPDWRKIALYDAEIAYMDLHFGKLLARLRKLGLYDSTLILVTADHGELLGEHGEWGHGHHLYQEELAIPFILKRAGESRGSPKQRMDAPVQLTGVPALLLTHLGVPIPSGMQGGLPGVLGRPILAEVYPPRTSRWVGDWRASFRGAAKLLCNSLGNDALYDLALDPRETTNLIASRPVGPIQNCDALLKYLGSLPPPHPSATDKRVDEETRKALESLGYLE